MTDRRHDLPPELQSVLVGLLRRHQRHRALHAALRYLLWMSVPSALALLLWLLEASVSGQFLLIGWLVVALLVAAPIAWPFVRQPLTLRDVAAHVDRQQPELKDRLLSAVTLAGEATDASAWMLSSFFADTAHRIGTSPMDKSVQAEDVRRVGVLVGLVLLSYFLLGGWGWRIGIEVHTPEPRDMERVVILPELTVKPGDVTVTPGERVTIWANSEDTQSPRRLFWESDTRAEEARLETSSSPEVTHFTFESLSESLTYSVAVGARQSPRYQITVDAPPAVDSIQVHYEYPAYLGRASETIPFAGDISAVEGTIVTISVRATEPVREAHLEFAFADTTPLEASEGGGVWSTRHTLVRSDRYTVALLDEDGTENPHPAEYVIDVQPDNAPKIQVREPRGDSEVLALEEVNFSFALEDDFGIASYGLEYAIAGQEPVRLELNEGAAMIREVIAGHMLALEELSVTPGDLVTWSVWADDKKPGRPDYEVMSDPFFLEIRPYNRRFREQITKGGEGKAGSSLEQRQIVISLWNLRKSAPDMSEEAFAEARNKIRAAQQTLREKAAEAQAAGGSDPETLGEAIGAMELVEKVLGMASLPSPEAELSEAISHAQAAFHHLLRAMPEERQIARSEGGKGGGSASEEIEELELSKRKDYQEEARTGEETVAEKEALRDSLEELSRRQELLNEDVGKMLAEESKLTAEEKKRRLERLEKEQERQLEDLDKAAREIAASSMNGEQRDAASKKLQEARKGMEAGLESVRQEALQQARAAGKRAESALEATETALGQLTQQGAQRQFAGLQGALEDLASRHEALEGAREEHRVRQDAPGLSDAEKTNAALSAYQEEKLALANDMAEFLQEAGTLSDRIRKEQAYFSRKLGDWVRETSATRVVTDMESAEQYARYGMWDAARMADAKVREKLSGARAGLEGLADEWPEDERAAMNSALEKLAALEESLADSAGDEDTSQSTTGEPTAKPDEGEENEGGGESGPADTPLKASAEDGGNADSEAGQGTDGSLDKGTPSGVFENATWRDGLSDAVALLPRRGGIRAAVEQVGLDLGRMQRNYDSDQRLPEASEFEQVVRRPLREAIESVAREVARAERGDARALEDEGAVPSRYAERVAEYFRRLAEAGEQP